MEVQNDAVSTVLRLR